MVLLIASRRMKSIFYFSDESDFLQAAKKEVLMTIQKTLEKYKSCRIGLAGGSTLKELYQTLSQEDLPWDKIEWIVIDERMVPSDHSESNLGMIQKTLFQDHSISPKLFAFDTTLSPQGAVKQMSTCLQDLLKTRSPLFDLLLLGAGADGHIASLFESDAALQSSEYASVARAKDYPIEERLTLTLPALIQSTKANLFLKGQEKQKVVDSLEGNGTLPLTALNRLKEKMTLKVYLLLPGSSA